MAGKIQLQQFLENNSYSREGVIKNLLRPVLSDSMQIHQTERKRQELLTKADAAIIDSVVEYGKINFNGSGEIYCFEVKLKNNVRLEQNRITIQRFVPKLLTAGSGALVSFYRSDNPERWRLSLVTKDSQYTESGIKEVTSNAKRYTYMLGKSERCRTAAERLEELSKEPEINLDNLTKAFSVEKLSDDFFCEYQLHYERLWKFLNNGKYKQTVFHKSTDPEKALRDFSKKMLGRVVFLYFLQKKRWLGASDTNYKDGNENFMLDLLTQANSRELFYDHWLKKLFFKTLNQERKGDIFQMPNGSKTCVPYLNGGLFEPEFCDGDKFIFTIPSEFFHNPYEEEIGLKRNKSNEYSGRGFFDFLKAYNFTIYEDSPDDHTIAVDPEMLGHIFENLLEDNNDKGTFYTPKEIVHYMCQQSFIEYLVTHLSNEYTVYKEFGDNQVQLFGNDNQKGQSKLIENISEKTLSHEQIEKLIIDKDTDELDNDLIKKIDKLLNDVKICDPAIGSGAFPMGLLHEIYSLKRALYLKEHGSEKGWDGAKAKLEIILNSIHGIDIEKGAIDIARLRFWLSLVVEENLPTPLPNLDFKLICADSLIGMPDYFGGNFVQLNELLDKFQSKVNIYFSANTTKEKANLHKDLEKLINEITNLHTTYINQISKDINKKQKTATPKQIKELQKRLESLIGDQAKWQTFHNVFTGETIAFFEPKYFFPAISKGFDIVIGNPPYVQLQKDGGKLAEKYEDQGYETFERTGDIYSLFYERGYKLLKEKGLLCFITSNKWMRAGYGESTRKFFAEKTNPALLIDFAGQKIFDSATVDTNILLFTREKNKEKTNACVVKEKVLNNLSVFIRQQGSICNFNNEESWVILSPIEKRIKEKIERIGIPLKNWDIQINYGIKTGFNEAFIINGEKRKELIKQDVKSEEIIRPILRGRDIKRYGYDFADLWIINTHNGIKEKGVKPIDIANYPAIKKHLDQYYRELEKRADKGDSPYNLRNCAYMEDFFSPKIIYPGIMRIAKSNLNNFPRFTFDKENNFFFGNDCYFITGNHLEYLWLILNSSLLGYLFRYYIYSFDETGFKIFTDYFQNIPIPLPNKQSLKKAQTFMKENIDIAEINSWVYQMIGLTEEEIKEIENSVEIIINGLTQENENKIIET